MRLIIAMTGGSGVQYGLRLIETLVKNDHKVDLVISNGAKRVLELEVQHDYESIIGMAQHHYDINDIAASIASGTHPSRGMVIVPCSMKSLAAIVHGFSENLIHRAAACTLKEERKLVLVTRETPLSSIHLENMLKAKRAGATILPASPGFYYHPQSVDDVVNFIVGKILNVFRIKHHLFEPWDPNRVNSQG